ncbi:MAG TPA: diadenylate cyclase [Bacteroidota bacterium]|nr:diadenylate cyclase [Bacteroidota bacterium]
MFEIFESVGVPDLLDILFMTIVIYSALVWFKRTRAGFAVLGLFIFGAVYLLARQLDLTLTTIVFQGFFAIILIAIVILFQEEIKHFLEQLASRSLIQGRRLKERFGVSKNRAQILVDSLNNLARQRIGAIIAVRGKDPISRHLNGGIALNGEVSEELIRSIFNPSAPGHDGAVVIEGDRVTVFSCYLPLSRDFQRFEKAGSRHAAALGLAELTDALCLVVSEERGTISVARGSRIRALRDAEELRAAIAAFYEETLPTSKAGKWKSFFKKSYRELAIAFGATVILWFFFVHATRIDYRTFTIPVEPNIPQALEIHSMDPPEVQVTFSGTRRAFWFIGTDQIKISLKFQGRGTFRKTITRSDISSPEGLVLENIEPNRIVVQIGGKS